jgi:putative colanic acid biosynthesis acetyltransferase WcaF
MLYTGEKMPPRVQDLKSFRLPPNFRGRPGWYVQIWWLVQATLFRWSPQFLYGWRRLLLRLFGAKIGQGVLIRPTAQITYPWKLSIGDDSWVGDYATLYTLGEIEIGDNVCVSQHCYLAGAGHDYSKPTFDMIAKKIVIESEAWLAASVFVTPGVRVGSGAVVGACSVVLKDLPAMMICTGNPAKPLRARPVSQSVEETAAMAERL